MKKKLNKVTTKTSNRKKWILIGVQLIVGLLIFWGLILIIITTVKEDYIISFSSLVIPILISIYLELLIVYLIVSRKIKRIKLKKYFKWILIISFPFFVFGTYTWLANEEIVPDLYTNIYVCNRVNCNPLRVRCRSDSCSYWCYDKDLGRTWHYQDCPEAWKPIIYLYPTVETEVNIKLGAPENLSHTYPKYNPKKGRNVIAQPNGDLKDIDTGRKLYALYREGKGSDERNFDEGFVVEGKNIIPFLEEKLAILGLNERETEEFIVYWLPQMEKNEWNLIRFETKAEQDENMPLNITPEPDTVIRVMMEWKSIDRPIDIPEQQLVTPERVGFTVVEWGGSPRN